MLLKWFLLFGFISPFQDVDKKESSIKKTDSIFEITSFWLIHLHQQYLTQIDGPRSHFYPCSSSFMKQAITKHGFFYGSLLGLDRLLRENDDPWIYKTKVIDHKKMKLDPVKD